ncbi:response regulator [Roseateles sp. BYS87W]|uniref:Response regulator n=1 Tax=Pelomonas baiyunensis TaxID=3299026 RepID=A0ABW7H057_9BURK
MSATAWQVLYVEDDPVNALLMQGILELRQGVALRVARSGEEARRLVTQGRVDLLLCDLHLPDVDGNVLLAQLRETGLPAEVPAVLVTAESESVAAQLARQHGFQGHWRKPLDVAATLRQLDHWMAVSPPSGT